MASSSQPLPRYDIHRSYQWNYEHAPDPVDCAATEVPGEWTFCGIRVPSPIGIPAGPLLNGRWLLYYASLGFDVLTYKTVRSHERECYDLPNLQHVATGQLDGTESELATTENATGSWAVSFGMPSRDPDLWMDDIRQTREKLSPEKVLNVSVVASEQPGWTIEDLADDYARCAALAVESGADTVETNFSCPNVSSCDGQLFQQPVDAAVVARRVREAVGTTPYIAKLGHVNQRELACSIIELLGPHVDAFAMTNSVATRVRHGDQLLFDGQRRGICGAATKNASVAQTAMFRDLISESRHDIELIGVGGVETASDVRDYIDAGAKNVQLATAAMLNPRVALELRASLAEDA